ncbi:hypothetical protein HY839_04015 [Candidatus Azambacteria bacterium]|nr:hypothetical protein [Candidatus Azambacteria bacterium]
MKNALYIIIPVVLVGAALALFSRTPEVPAAKTQATAVSQNATAKEKVYVALEEEGKIAVIDPRMKKVTAHIDLVEEKEGVLTNYMPHNVQVAPNGQTVWVTANVMENAMQGMAMGKSDPTALDEVIVIDPRSDRIITRIPIGSETHLAHVVVTPDNATAYVTLQNTGAVYAINAKTYAVEKKIALGKDSGPHGLRMSVDGSKAFIALLAGKAIAALDARTGAVKRYPMNSGVVQTAVTRDGKYAFASLYGTKQIARFDTASETTTAIDLPAEAKGPVQLYATPDSQHLFVADQGYYFDQPESNKVYEINIASGALERTITAGKAPHGIVVDKQGIFVYLTNLLSNDVSVIDIAQNKEIARIPVGKMPNGISVWNSERGGTE